MNLLGAEEYVCGMNHEKGIFLFATEKTLKEFCNSSFKSCDATFQASRSIHIVLIFIIYVNISDM